MISPLTLLLAALVSAPALWSAFVDQTMPVHTALLRFLIAVPVCAGLLALFRGVLGAYGNNRVVPASRLTEPDHPARRRTDSAEPQSRTEEETGR